MFYALLMLYIRNILLYVDFPRSSTISYDRATRISFHVFAVAEDVCCAKGGCRRGNGSSIA